MLARISDRLAEAIKALGELIESLAPRDPAPELIPIPVEKERPRRKPRT